MFGALGRNYKLIVYSSPQLKWIICIVVTSVVAVIVIAIAIIIAVVASNG